MYAMLTGTLPFTVEPFSLRALHQKMVDKEMNPLPPSLSTGKHKKYLCKQLSFEVNQPIIHHQYRQDYKLRLKERSYRVSKINRLAVLCYLL